MATHENIKRLSEPFPEKHISIVKKRNVELQYISHAQITKRLNEVDPDWSIKPAYLDPSGGPAYERCPMSGTPMGAWFELTICGVTKTVFGSYEPPVNADTKKGLQEGSVKWSPFIDPDAPKKILSDAISTGAARWGTGAQLWDKTTNEKSSEQERQKAINDLRAKVKAGPEALAEAAKNYLAGRSPNELSDLEFKGFEDLVEYFNTARSPLAIEFLVRYSLMSADDKAPIDAVLVELGETAHTVSDDGIRELESRGVL